MFLHGFLKKVGVMFSGGSFDEMNDIQIIALLGENVHILYLVEIILNFLFLLRFLRRLIFNLSFVITPLGSGLGFHLR